MMPITTPEDRLAQVNDRASRYKLGQFFTPAPIAAFMADAVQEVAPESVLDPGVGGGVLLRPLAGGPRLFGLDLDPSAVAVAREALPGAEIACGDFLDQGILGGVAESWPLSESRFDAVVSNPPYIRHHNLSPEHKALAGHYSTTNQVKVSSLSGSYVYFLLEAIDRLREGGRLVFITPTEFLDVKYGGAVKEALLSRCDLNEVVVLEMDELAFEGVLTTSAITIATKRDRPSRSYRLTEAKLTNEVERGRSVDLDAAAAPASVAWTPLLPTRAERIAPLVEGRTARLGDYATVRRGIATGDNSFFCLTQAQVDEHGIEPRFLVPVVVGSKDLPLDGVLDEAFHRSRLDAGARGWLLWCHEPKEALSGTRVLDYIEAAEDTELPGRFNCRTRKPWYGVEQVRPADFFVTYMSRDRARFVRNAAGARCMTSLLNVWAKPPATIDALQPIMTDPQNAVLLREFGRTYGGGLGKIEPNDLRALPVRPLQPSEVAA